MPCHVTQGCHASLPGSARPCAYTHISCIEIPYCKLLITFEIILTSLNCSRWRDFVCTKCVINCWRDWILSDNVFRAHLGFSPLSSVLCSCASCLHALLNCRINDRFHWTQVGDCAVSGHTEGTFQQHQHSFRKKFQMRAVTSYSYFGIIWFYGRPLKITAVLCFLFDKSENDNVTTTLISNSRSDYYQSVNTFSFGN